MSQNDGEIFDNWFHLADKNRDGLVSGEEAREFFQRAQLSKETLFEIWRLVAGDDSFLTKPKFYSTMRLIALAQLDGGSLDEGKARRVLVGMGQAVPPPKMLGLSPGDVSPSVAPTWTTQQGGAGQGYGNPGIPVSQNLTQAFPPMAPEDVQRYQALFASLDTDRDGYVKGTDCFHKFLQWGLGQAVLKEIWNVAAGANVGQITAQQFVTCIYLMDNAKRGIPTPRQIPPGQFPPVGAPRGPAPAQPPGAAGAAAAASFQMQGGAGPVLMDSLAIPELGPRGMYQPTPPTALVSQTPRPEDAALGRLAPAEQQRLQNERQLATQLESDVFQRQAADESATAKAAFYQRSLQEVTLFKSRMNAALIQIEERLARDTAEAEDAERRYARTYADAESSMTSGRNLLARLQAMRGRKIEAQTKLAELQKDVEQLGTLSPNQVAEEEQDLQRLQQEVTELTASKQGFEVRAAGARAERDALQRELTELTMSVTAAQIDVDAMQRESSKLKGRLQGGEDGDSAAAQLQAMLKTAADTYRGLLDQAKSARVPVPPEALLAQSAPGLPTPLTYDNFAHGLASDWVEVDYADGDYVAGNAAPSPAQSRSTSPSPSHSNLAALAASSAGASSLAATSFDFSGPAPTKGSAASSSAAAVDPFDVFSSVAPIAPMKAAALPAGGPAPIAAGSWEAFS